MAVGALTRWNICCAKGWLQYSNPVVEDISHGLQEHRYPIMSGRPKPRDSEAVLQVIEANLSQSAGAVEYSDCISAKR